MAVDTKKSFQFEFWALTILFILEYTRPMDFFKPFSYLQSTKLLALFLLFYWWKNSDKTEFKEKLVSYYLAFFILIPISIFWVVNQGVVRNLSISFFLMTVSFILPSIIIINSRKRIMDFFYYWMLGFGFVSIYAITHGGYGPGNFVLDENDTAMALNVAVPFAFLLARSTYYSSLQKKVLFITGVILCLGVVATFSRGGFLGLIAVLGVFWWWSKSKVKSLIVMAIVITIGFYAARQLNFISDAWIEDMQSIQDTKDDTRNERILSWQLGWEMFKKNPIVGVGAQNYPWNVGMYEQALKDNNPHYKSLGGRQAHSIYFTLIPELGLIGIYIYLCILFYLNKSCKNILDVNKQYPDNPEANDLALIALATRMGMVAYLITGVFISVLYYPNLWHLIGFIVAAERLSRKITVTAQEQDNENDPETEIEPEAVAEKKSTINYTSEKDRISYKL